MKIAVLEDDPEQSQVIELWMRHRGMIPVVYETGGEFLRHAFRENFDAYVLDWNLPDISGIDVLQTIRKNEASQHGVPVLFATVVGEESAIVLALESGADDYLVKPLREYEMMARLFSIQRRSGREIDSRTDITPFVIDTAARKISCGGNTVELTPREYELACLFLEHAGELVSRKFIQEKIWNNFSDHATIRSIDTHVSRLRKLMWSCPANGWRIKAVYQHGYRLERTATVSLCKDAKAHCLKGRYPTNNLIAPE